MKRTIGAGVCFMLIFSSLLLARSPKQSNSPADWAIQIDKAPAVSLDREGLFSSAPQDTYLLAEYYFESPPGWLGDAQGWTGEDRTDQAGEFWQVETYRVISGNQSLWCGTRPGVCNYRSLPGYGNSWKQTFESVDFTVSGDVTLTFAARYDSEADYDWTTLSYSIDAGDTWHSLGIYEGDVVLHPDTFVITEPLHAGSIRFQFYFASDGAWSDEDGLFNTDGAFILDDLIVTDDSGVVDSQDFESEAVGAKATADGDWAVKPFEGYGDYSGLFLGATVLQEDACTRDLSWLWGFFNGSTDTYYHGGHPEQLVVPYGNERDQYINNAVISPPIDWNPGGVVPATAQSAVFDFWVYRDLPLDNLIFYTFEVTGFKDGCPTGWRHRDFVYYGPYPDWNHMQVEFGDLIPDDTEYIRLAFICHDMCWLWCSVYGTGYGHSHAPLFDTVKFYRIDNNGPVWQVYARRLFQDNFPADGTLTGTVRIDIATDITRSDGSSIVPGDSLVIEFYDQPIAAGPGGRGAVYCYVRSTGGGMPLDWQSPETGPTYPLRYPYTGTGPTAGGFYRFQMDNVYRDPEMTQMLSYQYCFDLNDSFFTPPARIDFYLAATDTFGVTSYWSEFTGTTLSQAAVEEAPMEMQCLPTGGADVLYVDGYDGWGGEIYFATALVWTGLDYDRYDVRSPSSQLNNGLGSRAQPSQIVDVYKNIIWHTGDLPWQASMGNGEGPYNESPDAQLLYIFLDQSSAWEPGLYFTGDNIAEALNYISSPPIQALRTYIDFSVISYDHRAQSLRVSPQVIGLMPGTFFQHSWLGADTLIAFGGCPDLQQFDVLAAAGTSKIEMYYEPDPGAGAVIAQESGNSAGTTARVVLEGFSFHSIRDDRPQWIDRADHLRHIFWYFHNALDEVDGVGDIPLETSLSQNYPNPFNPTTTIEFALAAPGPVSLKIYNVAGQLVRTLVEEKRRPDVYKEVWDGFNSAGQPVASGVYFYRLSAGDFVKTRKMVLLK